MQIKTRRSFELEHLEEMLYHKKSVKSYLTHAYFVLLSKKPYIDITVSELTKQAGVSRVSFYRNFSTLDEVMEYGLKRFYEIVTKDVLPLFIKDKHLAWKKLIKEIFTHIKLYNEILVGIPHQNVGYLSSKLSKLFENTSDKESTNIQMKYLPFVNLSIVLSIAIVWLESGFLESVDEISEFAYKTISQNL